MNNLKDLESMQVALKEFRLIGKRNREILLNMLNTEHEVLGDSVEDPCLNLRKEYLAAGGRRNDSNNFIFTIKRCRELTGLGLREAKELVESW